MKLKHPLLLLFLAGPLLLLAQEPVPKDTFDITKRTMMFPHHYKKWGARVSAGLSMVQPPKDLVENAIQAPLVNVHLIFGLPWKFTLESQLTTIVVSNQLTLGPRISLNPGKFGINAGWDVGFVYGQMKQYGFDNSTVAWIQYPNVALGYKMKKMAFTLKGELVVVSHVSTKSGENEITGSNNFFNGFTAAFYIEQRIHKNKVFVIGIKENYVKYYWPTWLIFTTFNRYYNIPELYFSWVL